MPWLKDIGDAAGLAAALVQLLVASRAVDGAAARRRRDPLCWQFWAERPVHIYRSSTYAGHAFFGTGGSEADETALFDDGNKHRVDVPAPAAAVKSGLRVIARPGLAEAWGSTQAGPAGVLKAGEVATATTVYSQGYAG